MKTYRAEYSDEEFEIIRADSDREAIREAAGYEDEHRFLFNVYEIDENYNKIRFVY